MGVILGCSTYEADLKDVKNVGDGGRKEWGEWRYDFSR